MKTVIAVVLGFLIMWAVFYAHDFAHDPMDPKPGCDLSQVSCVGDSADQAANDPNYLP